MTWYKSKKGWVTGMVAVAYFVLDHWGRIDSAREIYRGIKKYSPPWSTVSIFIAPILFVLALGFFELDRRKGMRPKPIDLNALKGRTLKLRDDMQSFLDSAPSRDGYEGRTRIGAIEHASGSALRVVKLHHGYELHFADAAKRIFHEFGERNVYDVQLHDILYNETRQVNNEVFYRAIIGRLSDLAQMPESEG